jgi:RNA polymerase sigma factor (sigma-70 family)
MDEHDNQITDVAAASGVGLVSDPGGRGQRRALGSSARHAVRRGGAPTHRNRPGLAPAPESTLRPRLTRHGEDELVRRIADARHEVLVLALQSEPVARELTKLDLQLQHGERTLTQIIGALPEGSGTELDGSAFSRWCEDVARLKQSIGACLAKPNALGQPLAREASGDWPSATRRHVGRQREALAELVREMPLSEATVGRLLAAAKPLLSLETSKHPGSARLAQLTALDLLQRFRRAERQLRGAEAEFIQANQGLVAIVVKRYLGVGLSYSDLMQEGNIGLLRAVEKFDYRRGCRFSTYATWWIRQAVRRALANQARTIRLPVHAADARYALRQASNKIEVRLGRAASNGELAEQTGLAPATVRKLMNLVSEPVSLEAPRGEDGETCLYDSLSDPGALDPAEQAHDRLLKAQLGRLVTVLSPREERMVRLRFGLDGRDERTLDEIGLEFSVTRERVRQLLQRALAKLRDAASADLVSTDLVSTAS